MTNNVRGVVTQEIDGKAYGFRLGANEWCELEDDLGKGTSAIVKDIEIMARSNDVDMRLFRSIFRAALSYSEPEATARDAGDLMEKMGMESAGLLVVKIIQAGMPKVEAKGGRGKPQRAVRRR
ncbi:hypothetical protein GGE07_002474 [Sinorhizobium terangae]|uniref:Gene transfer agent family protein n=1 Tax=Sinorhizobium terangae TaxID=110322 RepID=A0A6N7LND9_SINTE|nr:hypothetical protein [Sinorhizobium terangae]MBB4185824.1 hypothetical protein [Sinorhizobium terangae]MQX19381.1 hypothetical protein [Sinorhizobium terangae]